MKKISNIFFWFLIVVGLIRFSAPAFAEYKINPITGEMDLVGEAVGGTLEVEGVKLGIYNASETYSVDDVVVHGGAIYTCIQAGTGQTPDVSPAYWEAGAAIAVGTAEGQLSRWDNTGLTWTPIPSPGMIWNSGTSQLEVNADTDASTILGRALISSSTSDFMTLSHFDRPGAADFAIRQDNGGLTRVNSRSGRAVEFSIANAVKAELLPDGTFYLHDSAVTPPFHVVARSVAPTTPDVNDMYLDDGTNTGSGSPGWRIYIGAAWVDVGALAAGAGDLLADGTVPLTAGWDAGGHEIRAESFYADVAIGGGGAYFFGTKGTYIREAVAGALQAVTSTGGGFYVDADRIRPYGSGNFSSLRSETASATNPGVCPRDADPDTGVVWIGDDSCGLTSGAVNWIRGDESAGTVTTSFPAGDVIHGGLTRRSFSGTLADDASIDLPADVFGWGFVQVEGATFEAYAQFTFKSDAEVFILVSENAADTDTDGSLCVFDNGTSVRIRNRGNESVTMKYSVKY